MSAAENFVGATVSYIDGTVTNTGNQTVTHAIVTVTFKDDIGQLAQREDVPLHVLDTSGPYPDAVDLSVAPLAPGQSKPFRLTFETISQQWNHEYPELTRQRRKTEIAGSRPRMTHREVLLSLSQLLRPRLKPPPNFARLGRRGRLPLPELRTRTL